MNNKWIHFYKNDLLCKLGNNVDTGHLAVTVKDRESGNPVTFAVVSVYFLNVRGVYGEAGEAYLIERYVTDEEGKIPILELQIIDKSKYPLSQYYMTVTHFRYFPVSVMNLETFPNVTTEYNVLLTPLTSKHPDYEYIITPIRPIRQ